MEEDKNLRVAKAWQLPLQNSLCTLAVTARSLRRNKLVTSAFLSYT